MMNKKLGRLLRPNMGWYILILLAFALAAAGFQNFLLAGVALVITALMFWVYMNSRNRRKKRLQEFIQQHLDETSGAQGIKPPFPMLVLRLEDSGIVNASRYRSRNIPTAGALLKEEDSSEKQIAFEV